MNSSTVQVRELTVLRGGRLVLDRLTLDVFAGTVTGLVGPSGGGKTTLIRAIAGVQLIRAGQIQVLGLPAGSAQLRGRVGYATQTMSVYPDLTVEQNLRYFATIAGAEHRAIDEALHEVELTDRRTALTGRLSGGQRARVSLAAALLGRPALLLLDEPTVGLDPVLRRQLWQLFQRLADGGVTLLVSSHVMDEAARCERVLLLRDGRLVADDTPDGLRRNTGQDDLEQAFLVLAEQAAGPNEPLAGERTAP
ncbi:MAG: ABC transporter ATP-binding protein [Jatrophihabitantaceae bacterium]